MISKPRAEERGTEEEGCEAQNRINEPKVSPPHWNAPEPQTFTAIADKRAPDLHIEALRRTIWALIESGALSPTPDRRIFRSEG